MVRPTSQFDTASLTQAADLAGPALACQRAIKEQQNRSAGASTSGKVSLATARETRTRRLGESLWEIWMPNPLCRLGAGTVLQLGSWPAKSSQGTQRLSTRVSQDGQIMLRWRKNPRSFTSCCMPRHVCATASNSTPWMCSRASWAWCTLCCPSLLSSPSSSRMEVRSTGSWVPSGL